jgi:hypothetical protein
LAWIFWILAIMSLLAWAAPLIDAMRSGWQMLYLDKLPIDDTLPLPRLSIIVPALNEEDTVEAAMRTLLTLDYPDLEIIAVDDRSTDGTGAIMDRLAAEDDRLQVVHVTELPAGWLGKNHAMHVGGQAASGEFILFTDADVHLDRSVLRRAVSYAQSHTLDHLVLFPEVVLKGFWETVSVWFFGVMFSMTFRPWRLADPNNDAFIGVGAFNVVRAEVYRRAGGHAALPMDVADDMKLGKKMKQAGGRADVLMSGGLVKVRWVVGLRGIVLGLTKNMFAGLDFNPLKALGGVVGLFILAVWPVVGLFVGGIGPRLICAGVLLLMVYIASRGKPTPEASALYGLAFPLAGLVVIYIIFRSMFYTYRQGGVVWRGTLYPLEELRKGIV